LDTRVQSGGLETVGVLRSLTSAGDVRAALETARNAKVRRAALQSLALLAIPGDRAVFRQYAGDSDSSLRAAALEGLGRIREPEDTPLLDTAFNEKNADWRIHLAAAFGLVDEGRVDLSEFSPLRFLIENLDQSGRDETAQVYLNELVRREDVRKAVYSALPGVSASEKVALCTALGLSRASDAIPVLSTLSRDPNPDVSIAANKSLRIAQSSPTANLK
jgi:hypothetical protein